MSLSRHFISNPQDLTLVRGPKQPSLPDQGRRHKQLEIVKQAFADEPTVATPHNLKTISFDLYHEPPDHGVCLARLHSTDMLGRLVDAPMPIAHNLRSATGKLQQRIYLRIAWPAYPDVKFEQTISLFREDCQSITKLDLARAVSKAFGEYILLCKEERPARGTLHMAFGQPETNENNLYLIRITSTDCKYFKADIARLKVTV